MQRLIHFEVWRWCFFFAGQAPVYFLGEFIVHVCFLFAENLFFKVTFAFYYAVSVKVGCLFLAAVACKPAAHKRHQLGTYCNMVQLWGLCV